LDSAYWGSCRVISTRKVLLRGRGSGFKLLWLLERLTGLIPRGATIYIALATVGLACLALAAGFRTDRSQAGSVRWLGWLLIAFLALASPHYPGTSWCSCRFWRSSHLSPPGS
jgi:hypothetical protein